MAQGTGDVLGGGRGEPKWQKTTDLTRRTMLGIEKKDGSKVSMEARGARGGVQSAVKKGRIPDMKAL